MIVQRLASTNLPSMFYRRHWGRSDTKLSYIDCFRQGIHLYLDDPYSRFTDLIDVKDIEAEVTRRC